MTQIDILSEPDIHPGKGVETTTNKVLNMSVETAFAQNKGDFR